IVQEMLERMQLIENGSDLDNYQYKPIFYNPKIGKVTALGKEIVVNGSINRS
ncbi:chromosome partitioning protein ParA, partial [Listeria monocytogenes]|nr:chromosome partitioning protein ParA [Listeria monocytogenes]